MLLRTLLQHTPIERVQGDLDRDATGVSRDTREVGAGGVFVAIEGASVDGHDLVDRVPFAAAVVVQRPVQAPGGVTVVQVADSRAALASLAAAFHGFPAQAMKVIGVTGTNGKTTVTTLVEEALRHAGRSAGRIGTTGVSVNGKPLPSALTTPEAPALQATLATMRDAGVQVVAMEVSSIGLVQHRVGGIAFHAGVFTNLSQDHLDLHGTMQDYGRAKSMLFQQLRPGGGPPRAVLCGDDAAWSTMHPPADHWLYGFGAHCHLRIRDVVADPEGMALTLDTPAGHGVLRTALVGRFNALNLAAALGCCLLVGLPLAEALEALGRVPGVDGRLERVPDPHGRLILVDYAHTPDALAQVLQSVRDVTPGRLWVVFGCGGDRDPGKRPLMGQAAASFADEVVVTSDNPRSEDPQSIVDAILQGVDVAHVELDRAAAIAWTLATAQAGDTVLIAGKGHETYQEIKGQRHPFDDRAVARALVGGA